MTPDAADLEELFAELAANISKPGATNIQIKEKLTGDFELVDIDPPATGTAIITGVRSLMWNIESLGTTASESAALHFTVRHVGASSGELYVNESIEYSDTEGNEVKFPDPTIEVDCGRTEYPDPCPEPREVRADRCEDHVMAELGDLYIASPGRIVELGLTLKAVWPAQADGAGRAADGRRGGRLSLDEDLHHPGALRPRLPGHQGGGHPLCRPRQRLSLPGQKNESPPHGELYGYRLRVLTRPLPGPR